MSDKMKFETPDLTADNVAKISELFPGVVTEGKVNFDLLRSMLGEEVYGDEAYEFTWVGKRAAIAEAGRPIRKTLRPIVEDETTPTGADSTGEPYCSSGSRGWDTTENLYIEGDNLDVLKLLQEGYLGKVKMVYIDPPYNTGKDSFVYRDKFTMDADEYNEAVEMYDEEGLKNFRENAKTNPRYHSDWCTSIYPVLVLARNVLLDDGIILINMDENEITNLQNLCAEVFGESNDLGTIIWDKRNPKGDAKGISYQHEYIVAYAKNKLLFVKNCKMQRPKKNAAAVIARATQIFKKVGDNYTLEEANREFATWVSAQDDFSGGEKAYNRIDKSGDVYRPVSMAWPNKKKAPDDYFIPLIHPITKKPCPLPERGWRNPSATMNELLKDGLILFGKDETTQPNRKYLLKENLYENIPSLLYYGGSDTDLLSELDIPFDTPKVVSIAKEHIQSFTSDGDIVLDFYSGSSTTAHAVMQLNAEDGGNRKFIMVQLPEITDEKSEAHKAGYKNICEIGKERIRRAGDKIKEENKDKLGIENLDTGFRVLKLDDTNMNDVYFAAGDYTQDRLIKLENNIKEDRTDMDLLFGCLLDWGLPLSMPHSHEKIDGFTVHTYNEGDLIACFEERISEKAVHEIAGRKPLRVVFRDSSFTSSPEKINVFEIFKLLAPNTTVKVI